MSYGKAFNFLFLCVFVLMGLQKQVGWFIKHQPRSLHHASKRHLIRMHFNSLCHRHPTRNAHTYPLGKAPENQHMASCHTLVRRCGLQTELAGIRNPNNTFDLYEAQGVPGQPAHGAKTISHTFLLLLACILVAAAAKTAGKPAAVSQLHC